MQGERNSKRKNPKQEKESGKAKGKEVEDAMQEGLLQTEFNRYHIPPDFDIVQLHHEAALVYDGSSPYHEECPCCLRKAGSKKVPLCVPTGSFLRISPQIPLYFSYVKVIGIILVLFLAAVGTQRMFSPSIEPVSFRFKPPEQDSVITIQIGFIETRREIRFVFFLIFTTLILFIRGHLKKHKYEVTGLSKKLSSRSVMLTNLPRRANEQDIRKRFQKYEIESVELTYQVKEYIDSLQAVYRLKKTLGMAKRRKKSPKYIEGLTSNILLKNEQIRTMKAKLKSPQNRLDFAFLTFPSEALRDQFLKRHRTGLLGRLFYKFCTCCSPTAIYGQHVNVFAGPDPEDIDWLHLQAGYWVKKTHRFACYYVSFAILTFGILLQYEISTFPGSSFQISIIKNLIVLAGNFLVVNFLEFTTYQIEKHELNTNKILSLVRKLTFFIFLNLSMSPFSIYLYYQFASNTPPPPDDTPFDELALSILIISIGNISKPLMEYLSVGRVVRRIGFYYQRFLDHECEMTQEEANSEFQPISFPLASFYSLLLSAVFLTAFFLSSFQLILVVEVVSCWVLYFISKYMLLRVCKEPIGLNHMISVLCQKMILLCVPLYWLGEKVMFFICSQLKYPDDYSLGDYLADLLDVYTIIQLALILIVLVFSSTILAWLSKKTAGKNEATESFIQRVNENQNKMTYADVNSIKQLQEEIKKYIDSMQ